MRKDHVLHTITNVETPSTTRKCACEDLFFVSVTKGRRVTGGCLLLAVRQIDGIVAIHTMTDASRGDAVAL